MRNRPTYSVIFHTTIQSNVGPNLANQQKNQLRGKQKRLRTPIIRKLDIKSRSHGIILLFTDLSQYPLNLCMIPGNVVFVEFSFPPNRRFYKEIISYQAKLFCVVLNATGAHNNLAMATTTEMRK